MKFDCIIGNPPFNDETSTANGTGLHSMTKQLHLEFLNRSINGVEKGGDVAIICPATKWWIGKDSDKNVAEYTKKGMKRVFNASKDGPAFDGAKIDNIGVFHLQSGNTKLDLNEFDHGIKKPKIAITDVFKFVTAPGVARPLFESKIKKTGKYKVWATVSVNGYTESNSLFADSSRGNWRVVFNQAYGAGIQDRFGPIVVASPEDYVSYSCNCFIVDTFDQARRLAAYLDSEAAKKVIRVLKVTKHNSKHVCSYIDGSQFAEEK